VCDHRRAHRFIQRGDHLLGVAITLVLIVRERAREEFIEALVAGATPAARRRATWLPRSLWTRRPVNGNGAARRAPKDAPLEKMSV
jgi:hypothetical protein